MKITFLTPCDNLTGGNRVVAMHARALADMGHDVLVVMCAPDPVRTSRTQRLKGWFARSADSNTAPAVPGLVALSGVPFKTLARPGPITADDVPDADIVIATWWETAVWMHGFPASKGRPVHLIQGYEVWFGAETTARVHAALRLPNTKVVISHDLQRTIEVALGPLPMTVVPNAIDPLQFNALPRAKAAQPTVGFVYSATHSKGADVCIEACRIAQQVRPDLQVLCFGTEAPAPAMPLPPNTRFVLRPPQDELKLLYAACDVWLFGSRLDSFGLPMLEAMACRTPVVAVPIGAAQWLLGSGGGTIVPPESPTDMAAALLALLDASPAGWQRVSDTAHQRAHSHTWRDAAQALLDCLPIVR